MSNVAGDARIQKWLNSPEEYRLFSTDWYTVEGFTDTLYNVEGSRNDPPIDGYDSWKDILVRGAGLHDSECYAPATVESKGSSHDADNNFMVGGHMTLSDVGDVPHGGTSYLMPLCKYHNHTTRNRVPFPVENKTVVALIGYMQGEHYATFAARLPPKEDKTFGLIYKATDGVWSHRDLSESDAEKVDMTKYPRHILLKKSKEKGEFCSIANIRMP